MAIAIKAENISKQYRLGYVGSGSHKDDASRWWARMRGKEDPLLTVGETNDRSTKGESDYVWALKDINFEIEQGDTVGIIGRNGAGKSTLLKILSKVTAPTTGNIKVKGRIASLLEVGTGFHGELTGRENIYLNGAIMGMRKHEITRKLDEIIDFAGVERYLDTPVKRYSSGMYVRLGFAVAAHLENEILIVDEVLAVGDAEFQQKCLGKMGDVSTQNGKTILFVSHNINNVLNICRKGILLSEGKILAVNETNSVVEMYSSIKPRQTKFFEDKSGIFILPGNVEEKASNGIIGIDLTVEDKHTSICRPGSKVEFKIHYKLKHKLDKPVLGIVIKDSYNNPIVGFNNIETKNKLKCEFETGYFNIIIPSLNIIRSGDYMVDIYFGENGECEYTIIDAFSFKIVDPIEDYTLRNEINLFYSSNILFR